FCGVFMTTEPSPREQLERLTVLLRRVRGFWKRGLVVFLVGAVLAFPYALTRPRSFRSDTVILYQEKIQASDVTGAEGGGEGARRVGVRLRELLFSRASLEPIIHDLNLYPDRVIRGEPIEAIEEMRKAISFKAELDGDTYDISFTGGTPQEAQEVTKRLGDCIVREAERRREDKAKTLQEFLAAESVHTDSDLKQQEDSLTRFVVLHPEYAPRLQGLPAPATTGPGGAAGASAFSSDPALASLEARAASIERRLTAKTAPSPAPRPASPFQPPPDSAELVAARHALADKEALFTDKHPDVIAAKTRLKAAEDAQAAVNAAALAAWQAQQSLDPGPPANPAEEGALRADLASLQVQIAARRSAAADAVGAIGDAGAGKGSPTPALELEFRRLQGEAADARDRQQQLQARLFRASIAASSVMDDRNIQVSILDPAYLPVRAISKPRSLLLAGLLAVCLALGIATAWISASLDDRVYEARDLERLDVPVIAVVPRPSSRPPPMLKAGPSDP
ncbi:MAG: GumC family protein, partial [Polyangiaceae bacterium]